MKEVRVSIPDNSFPFEQPAGEEVSRGFQRLGLFLVTAKKENLQSCRFQGERHSCSVNSATDAQRAYHH